MTAFLDSLGPHGPYILGAYGVVTAGLVGLAYDSLMRRKQWRKRRDSARGDARRDASNTGEGS